jgi:hypothetical protein
MFCGDLNCLFCEYGLEGRVDLSQMVAGLSGGGRRGDGGRYVKVSMSWAAGGGVARGSVAENS